MTVVGAPTMADASTGTSGCTTNDQRPLSSVEGRHLGVIYPTASCAIPSGVANGATEARYGSPRPLLKINGGDVMGTPSQPGDVTLTPIFWEPDGWPMTSSYQGGFVAFGGAVAAASGTPSNVFAVQTQYTDGRGRNLAYRMAAGSPIVDTAAFPSSRLSASCQPDAGAVYRDGAGYSACLTDDQIASEIARLTSAAGLPQDRAHLYAMITPRGVEVCFSSKNGAHRGSCTLSQATTAVSGGFCAYHEVGNGTSVTSAMTYAVIPYGIWNSPLSFTCEGPAQYPSGNQALDIALSSYSHEVAEAVTDPAGNGWHDVFGNENGDLCNTAYGTITSPHGAGYNQVIGAAHYLLQQEFSNAAWKQDHALGCQSDWSPPTVTLQAAGSTVVKKRYTISAIATSASAKVASYAWTLDGIAVAGKARISASFKVPGVHTAALTVTDSAGWSTTQSLTFSITLR